MNVMYSLLQLPPTVLFGVFALLLLLVKGHIVVPAFLGSITGYAVRTLVDFGSSSSQYLVLAFLEMILIAFLFWYVRKRTETRIHYPILSVLGIALYVCVFAGAAVYCTIVDF